MEILADGTSVVVPPSEQSDYSVSLSSLVKFSRIVNLVGFLFFFNLTRFRFAISKSSGSASSSVSSAIAPSFRLRKFI